MSETQKSIYDKHTFVEMLMNLNLKLQYEVGKANYVLPAGTIVVFPANDIDKLKIIFPSQEEEEEELTLEKVDNNIQEIFENAPIGLPKKRRGRPRKNSIVYDVIEIYDNHLP